MFFRFPYTDAHQLNLDWVIKQVKRIPELAASIPTKLSELLNDTGFINATQAAAAAPVQSVNGQTGDVVVTGTGAVDSVNGQTGAVVLTAADVGAKPSSYSAPVDSVNGHTGAVVLTAADVGAKPSSYSAPVDSVNGLTGAVVLTGSTIAIGTIGTSFTGWAASIIKILDVVIMIGRVVSSEEIPAWTLKDLIPNAQLASVAPAANAAINAVVQTGGVGSGDVTPAGNATIAFTNIVPAGAVIQFSAIWRVA